jgi:hypothetical protein
MNLQEQIGTLEENIDQINELAVLARAALAETAQPKPAEIDVEQEVSGAHDDKPTLRVSRPSQNALTLTIGSQAVTLHPEQIGLLIEELSNARASMSPEQPAAIPPGWSFVSTKNPVMAVQKQANGDRLLIARHTGHGWVPFTFSPDMVIQLYMLLTQR